MEVIVDRILGVLNREPIDIYVNPTFLPAVMAGDYDALWTPERMGKVIEAARKNDVAIEINHRYRIPSARFLKLAKQAGCRFSFGTNNTDRNVGRLEYCLEMVDECGLSWQDIFVPRAEGEKAIQRRGFA
jgi:histidinol phosphatase-like PHP family hydrolase